jgi:Protein of unknown function (DUF3828)
MEHFSRRYVVMFAIAITAVWVGDGMAQTVPEPVQIIRRFYQPYLKDDSAGGKSALDVIKPHATPELRRLIAKEESCARKQQGICNIDADVLIDGQDWKLSAFQVTALNVSEGRMTVRAAFRNTGRPTIVEFPFVKSGGRWLIADVHMQTSGETLTKLLQAAN